MIGTDIEIGELVWFTFDGAVPRLGVVSAVEASGHHQVLFEKEKYWVPSHHISEFKEP
tara:strand:+ start:1409 stop:1582 length:174 start_codon:yes stop_codon:yes gene_type:complete